MGISRDRDGLFACPCGFKRPVKFNVERHMATCRVVATRSPSSAEVQELKASLVAAQSLLRQADTKVRALQAQLQAARSAANWYNGKGAGWNTLNITNNITINLPTYKELTDNKPEWQVVRRLLHSPATAIPKYIEIKFFEFETPSIVLPRIDSPRIRIVEKDGSGAARWVTTQKNEIIEEMVDIGLVELETSYSAREVTAFATWIRQEGLDETRFDHTPAYRRLKKEVESVIFTKSVAIQNRAGRDEQGVPDPTQAELS